MANKKDTTLELDPPHDVQAPTDISAEPKLILTLGRGRVGKSTYVRWAAERMLQRGGVPVIADADRTNATLSAFFDNVVSPVTPADDDVRQWLGDLVERQIEQRFTCFLDLGGGDQVLKTWARDVELASFMEANGVMPVAMHFIGCEIDDLSYLRDIESVSKFQPEHVVLVLNEGLVPTGRVARSAFEPIINHGVFRDALARGAKVVRMPRLAAMHEVERRRLSFQDAVSGAVKPDQTQIGPLNRQMIAIWLREMEASMASIAPWIS